MKQLEICCLFQTFAVILMGHRIFQRRYTSFSISFEFHTDCFYCLYLHILFKYFAMQMNDRRTSSLCAASKMGFVLKFDPSGSGNRCYYRCLATFLNQNEDDVINSVETFMLNKQFIPVENEVSI